MMLDKPIFFGMSHKESFPCDQRPNQLDKGWAQGDYSAVCATCGDRFSGDKRAWCCADCAYGTPTDKPDCSSCDWLTGNTNNCKECKYEAATIV